MSVHSEVDRSAVGTDSWFARSTEEVATAFRVDPAVGLADAQVAELLATDGPNVLPEEKPTPDWRRFLSQYRSYMQLILIGAAAVSVGVAEWSTAVLLALLTVLNAVVGLRQEGKAESAMNALRSMLKATARVRRAGSEAEIPADQVVVGDVVILAAGDEVPADGRVVAASALQIDESALTGESTPAAKDAVVLRAGPLGPGEILSLGGVDLARRSAIVKDLPSVETLGFVSAINSDKTGTLTMNQMTVVEVVEPTARYTVSGAGRALQGQVRHAAGGSAAVEEAILPYLVANDAALMNGEPVGDPTECALLVLGHKAGLDVDITRERLPRLATLPFDPDYKLMATFHSAVDTAGRSVVRCFVKGAAPAVLSRVATARSGGATVSWDAHLREWAEAHLERMGGEGKRVMAAATLDLDPAGFRADGDLLAYVTGLHLTSLVGMVDPPRPESAEAIAGARDAHIRVRMVTGDDVVTGAAIAAQVGIDGAAILGADFAALPESERLAVIDDIGVVGRVAPEHKVLLADTLKKRGDVVAMTGDGVNDAPAIKAADIGIAMGTGTDVAKNASRMILSDDNFATIVSAVERGRKIYDNLAKYIRFVLILLVVFVLTFLGATLFDIAAGEPFTPAQVLWIHFLVNAPFGFALGFDRASQGLMGRRPRPRGESLLTTRLIVMVGLVGLVMTVGLLAMIKIGETRFGSDSVGNSIAFTSFALCLIVGALECRDESGTILTTATFDSKHMNWTVLGEFVLAVFVTQLDAFRRLLGTTQLSLDEFAWALVPAIALLILWELGKWAVRRFLGAASAARTRDAGAGGRSGRGRTSREPAPPGGDVPARSNGAR
ncbi:ATPase, P-type (transporting), HAD superfamily, subfamily IC [Parafrankia irregularis]|uniref:ATPase, P-type (Transporting), HAD superfamily, subfamily IC n=1 Tax=Parafrankia irregularis TaxID=795642 RepID=A0A0S4QQ75_9ACTN|nr:MULTISPECIES: HAD-IC family P-type ATPase [Parafrankia]MBE3201727.1 HAD-IC family P-type ATPase [Parafrankia sp. CH37]CUU57476.1 ATPase, P-type (transporting), HAD superfamily, subfamily IC [Parafrankia irregularis]